MATRRSKPLHRYRLTRLGFHFLFVALFAIIGGALRGFNLLLVLAGLLVSVVLVQWRQGRGAIRRTRLRRRKLAGTFAGTPMTIHYQVRNVSRWLPIWSIRIEDRVVAKVMPSSRTLAPPADHPTAMIASVGNVPAGQTRGTSVICRFADRGQYRLGPVVASTAFPFCLMNCERLAGDSVDRIFVYPRLIELKRGWKEWLPPRRGGDGHRSTGGTNHDGEFFGLRAWQSGDQVKHIHWRTTARIGEPAVRQFEQRNRHQICIVVDGVQDSAGGHDVAGIELVLRVATSMMCELATHSRSVSLLVADAVAMDHLATASDAANDAGFLHSAGRDLSELLERLAIAQACEPQPDQLDPLVQTVIAASSQLSKYDMVVVSNRRLTEVVPSGRSGAMANPSLSLWRFFDQTGRLSWIDVNSLQVKRYLQAEGTESVAGSPITEATDVVR